MSDEEKNIIHPAPLLSICIPTWNRGALLAGLLENLRREIQGLEDRVEIVVADNASDDSTAAVVKDSGLAVCYSRQAVTVGMASNIFFAACDLARGEFVWLIGDDDLVVPGGLRRVVESLEREPALDYHYINFGWIDVRQREKVLREMGGKPPESALHKLQFDLQEWRVLEKGEDLAFLPGYNPSSLFAGIFCYAARRTFYQEARSMLRPSDAFLDGSSNLLDDSFPHAMITVPKIIGKPIAYIGTPCMLQGVNGWEWGRYSYKTMLLGQYELMNWLEAKGFDAAALAHLRISLTQTTGRLFARMQLSPDVHFGADVLLEKVIPSYTHDPMFWRIYTDEIKSQLEIENEARLLLKLLEEVDGECKRVGLQGIRGRGEKVLAASPALCRRLAWIGDSDILLEGHLHSGCEVPVSRASTLSEAGLDILILAVSSGVVPGILDQCLQALKPGGCVISVAGIRNVTMNVPVEAY